MELVIEYAIRMLDELTEKDAELDRIAEALTMIYNERCDYLDGQKAVCFSAAHDLALGAITQQLPNSNPGVAIAAAQQNLDFLLQDVASPLFS